MKKYYLHNGIENIGPFDIEELKLKNITSTTQIWYEGISDWKNANEIDELEGIFVITPPPIKKEIAPPTVIINNKKPRFKKVLIAISIIVVILVSIAAYNNDGYSSDTPVLTEAEMEAAYPESYLEAGGGYHENFLGDKLKIEGFIQNNATSTTYKDVIIEITYYTKTNTRLASEQYTIYEFFAPKSKKDFKLKIKNYNNIGSIGWKAIGAEVKN